MVYWNKSGAKRRTDVGTKRTKYKTKPVELRGKTQSEPHVMKAFWQENNMDEMITLTPEEIDKKIDAFLVTFEAKNIKRLSSWWYPENIVIKNFK